MATWPITLPENFLVDGYQEAFANNVLRSNMEVGPPKLRRRSTAASKPISGMMYMTPDELAVLTTFFEDTLYDGALPFDWTHPRLGTVVSFQFMNPPSFRRHLSDNDVIGWMVTLILELLP